ncbi:MAG: methyltransferase domain-containing protein [bacterium]|nr:methyltransferase domain-containing protein [bacterium]
MKSSEISYRRQSFNILAKVSFQKDSLKNSFKKEILGIDNKQRIIAIKKTAYGVMQNKLFLEYALALKKTNPKVKIILLIATYELFFSRNKKHAIVNEACNLAKELKLNFAVGFINAKLRNLERPLKRLLNHLSFAEKLSIRYSYPQKLVDYLIDKFGQMAVVRFCIYFNKKPKLAVRVNKIKIETLNFNKIADTVDGYFAPDLLGIEKGEFFVQDIASQMACDALKPRAGDNILDCCSSPGGKLAAIASITGNKARITACDVSEVKIKKLEENIKRLGIKNVNLLKTDFLKFKLQTKELKFNKIILDAPCSGLGVLNKHVDAKYLDKDFKAFAKLQLEMLKRSADLLAVGGVLVYSVCTISQEETSDVITGFLKEFSEFTLEQEQKFIGFYFVKLLKS